MKQLTALLFICISAAIATAQDIGLIDELVARKRIQVAQIDAKENSTTTLIPSTFSENALLAKKIDLGDLTVVKVYYVYTQYRRSETFDQLQLDRERFTRLATAYPELFGNPLIEWELIEQTGCTDFTDGPGFFHGFILVHRPSSTSSDREEEIAKLMAYFDDPTKELPEQKLDFIREQLEPEKKSEEKSVAEKVQKPAEYPGGDLALYQYFQEKVYPTDINTKKDDKWVNVKVGIDQYGRIGAITMKDEKAPAYISDELSEALRTMPDWKPAEKDGKPTDSEVDFSIRVSYSRAVNGMYTMNGERPSFSLNPDKTGLLEEDDLLARRDLAVRSNAVYMGMELVRREEKLAVVMDVTGSMASNIAALKRWLAKNPDSLLFTSYSFFNDGDNKPTIKKKNGETGGIYFTEKQYEIEKTIEMAMRAGSGGEISESDVEAVLYAISHDSLCNAILLIGDNFSDIRDLSLLKQVTKPVNILLCSAPEAIRVEYLELARNTGGYLLLNGKKIVLDELKKGDQIIIQGRAYQYSGDSFKMKKEHT